MHSSVHTPTPKRVRSKNTRVLTAFGVLVALAAGGFATMPANAAVVGSGPAPDFSTITGAVTTIEGLWLFDGHGTGEGIDIYAKAGEDVAFELRNTYPIFPTTVTENGWVKLTDPSGNVAYSGEILNAQAEEVFGGTFASDTAGVWRLEIKSSMDGDAKRTRLDWNIAVLEDDGVTAIPGRISSDRWLFSQTSLNYNVLDTTDATFFALGERGAQYQVDLRGYNGVNSTIEMNNVGSALTGTCEPAQLSFSQIGQDKYWTPGAADCEDLETYRLFLEAPSADIPAEIANWADGRSTEKWGYSPYVQAELTDLAYERTDPRFSAGKLTGAVTQPGEFTVEVDIDGDGQYDDRSLVTTIGAAGEFSIPFDGKAADGTEIPSSQAVAFRLSSSKISPIYFVRGDVEVSTGGVEITQLTGPNVGENLVYWDDTLFENTSAGRYSVTTPLASGAAGVPSAGGVHRWAQDDSGQNRPPASNDGVNGSWGDLRNIVDWSFMNDSLEGVLAVDGQDRGFAFDKRELRVEDTNGDTLTGTAGDSIVYAFNVTNTGEVPESTITLNDPLLGIEGQVFELDTPLAPGATITLPGEYVHIITAEDAAATKVVNDADVTLPGLPTQTDQVVTPTKIPGIALDKIQLPVVDANKDTIIGNAGDTIPYALDVTNTGNFALTEVTLTDALLGIKDLVVVLDAPLAPGATVRLPGTFEHTITKADADVSSVRNEASVTVPGVPPVTDEVTTPVVRPGLDFDKRQLPVEDTNKDGINNKGDFIPYAFDATNTGNYPISVITLDDKLLGIKGKVFELETPLEPGATITLPGTYRYEITEKDGANGEVVNVATASTPGAPPVTDTVETPVKPAPVKPADPAEPTDPKGPVAEDPKGAVTGSPLDPANNGALLAGGVLLAAAAAAGATVLIRRRRLAAAVQSADETSIA